MLSSYGGQETTGIKFEKIASEQIFIDFFTTIRVKIPIPKSSILFVLIPMNIEKNISLSFPDHLVEKYLKVHNRDTFIGIHAPSL